MSAPHAGTAQLPDSRATADCTPSTATGKGTRAGNSRSRRLRVLLGLCGGVAMVHGDHLTWHHPSGGPSGFEALTRSWNPTLDGLHELPLERFPDLGASPPRAAPGKAPWAAADCAAFLTVRVVLLLRVHLRAGFLLVGHRPQHIRGQSLLQHCELTKARRRTARPPGPRAGWLRQRTFGRRP